MGLANVVLEYLKVLIWPTVLAFLFCSIEHQFSQR